MWDPSGITRGRESSVHTGLAHAKARGQLCNCRRTEKTGLPAVGKTHCSGHVWFRDRYFHIADKRGYLCAIKQWGYLDFYKYLATTRPKLTGSTCLIRKCRCV